MFELLTGQPPYTGSTVEAIGQATLNEPQPLASDVDARVPPGLSAIAAQAMARVQEARYPSARHLAQALQQWLQSSEGLDLQRSPKERQGQARQKVLLVVSAVALAIAAAALWRDQLVLQAQRARQPVAMAVAAIQAAPTDSGQAR
jgi:serine/threonine-protein kinase